MPVQAINTFKKHLNTVILLCSSSRGGSSITTEWLRQHNGLLHLPAEINPLLHQVELVYPFSGSSDALDENHCTKTVSEKLWHLLAHEVGSYHRGHLGTQEWGLFKEDLYKRLKIQWPTLNITLSEVSDALEQTRSVLKDEEQWGDDFVDATQFHCRFIAILRKSHSAIDPRLYDIDQQSIQQHFENLGPIVPPKTIIEEPPFVLISPWKRATAQELQSKPLVIKTPSNAYRIPFFRQFFSNQKLKILHLKREAPQAINGLIDGWLYPRGFHAHWISDLRIREAQIPRGLWKYDLPPGFLKHKEASLGEICAFQWSSSHKHILDNIHLADSKKGIWFSEIINNKATSIRQLFLWAGLSESSNIPPIAQMPPVMATCKPRAKRWFEKKDIIDVLTSLPHIQHCTERLYEATF